MAQPAEEKKRKPDRTWVTRADAIAALVLGVAFIVWVGVIVIRQQRAGEDIEIIQGAESAAPYLVDFNNAGKSELMLLPGIGSVRAERIIKRRDEDGPFKTLDEVRIAARMRDNDMQRLRDLVTLGESANPPPGGGDDLKSEEK